MAHGITKHTIGSSGWGWIQVVGKMGWKGVEIKCVKKINQTNIMKQSAMVA
jgi:hypothetical protein